MPWRTLGPWVPSSQETDPSSAVQDMVPELRGSEIYRYLIKEDSGKLLGVEGPCVKQMACCKLWTWNYMFFLDGLENMVPCFLQTPKRSGIQWWGFQEQNPGVWFLFFSEFRRRISRKAQYSDRKTYGLLQCFPQINPGMCNACLCLCIV